MGDLHRMNRIRSAGMKAQASRLRVIAENLANADSMAKTAGRRSLSPQGGHFHKRLESDGGDQAGTGGPGEIRPV